MIAIVDCNNFYASCERLFNPSLEGRPVVVLSNNDGCVIARSNEAKDVGIEMGAPAFMMEHFIRENNIAVFSSNYTLYGSLSTRVINTIKTFAPKVEVYSIDEAFIDLYELQHQNLYQLATTIRQTVKQHVGIPVTIGVAPTKTLAKMANRYAKKTKKETGVYFLDSPEKIAEVLAWTEIGDVWGIGGQHGRRLKWMGIKTAADFIEKLNPDWIRNNMSVVGERMYNELRGIRSIDWEELVKPKKGICTARSFGKLLSEKKDIQEALSNYAANCAAKLRAQNSCAGAITVLLQTNIHRTQDKQYSRNITLNMPVATNSTPEIIGHALKALDLIYRPGFNYKKTGAIVTEIVPESEVQQSFFDPTNRPKAAQVMKSMDSLNKQFGKDLLRFAVQGYSTKWKLRQQKLSPCYTTNIDQVFKVKV